MATPTHIQWVPRYDKRVRPNHGGGFISPAQVNRSIAFRKAMIHDGQIEQFTEKLPRRWWQLKAPTRIRIRRVRRDRPDLMFFNCQGKLTGVSGYETV